ncbi:MAG: exodeoxyribonuclease VII small subunit [Anaerolineae bacterium]|jgi:exodeoxyribonuclease VII small subunit
MSNDVKDLSFEQAVGELDDTVQRLEGGDLSLAEAIALYERGMLLVQHCNDVLDAAELQVQILDQPDSPSEA